MTKPAAPPILFARPGHSGCAPGDFRAQPDAAAVTEAWGQVKRPTRRQLPQRGPSWTAPEAHQVADPFHVVLLANTALDEVCRRVQNQTLGHRGHKHDPPYRARKLLVAASEAITENGRVRLRGLLDAGDPYGEVKDAWHAKETLRSIYDITDAELGAATVAQLAQDLQDP